MAGMNLSQVRYDLINLGGGLDQVTPTMSIRSGVARRAANFECSINGGYTRIAGYERFDGLPSPSASVYNLFECTLTGAVAVGDELLGLASAATGKVIYVSGGTIVVTKEVGTFTAGEGISVSATQVGEIDEILGVAADGLEDATYAALAADEYRADIGAVPGSGPVRGVGIYNGNVYAWRDTEDETAMKMYKATSSGWDEVDLLATFDFDNGLSEILEGDTIVGHSSGATALVRRVIVTSGSWTGGDAAGYIVFSDMTGTPIANEKVYVSGTWRCDSVGTYSVTTLQPGGRVTTVVGNMGGGVSNYRMYGADGVNKGFEFDGDVYVPITTGMAVDAPTRVSVHKQHLFFTFGASVQFSGLGEPYRWSPIFGAGEIAMSGVITDILTLPGDQTSGALAIYTRNDTSILYGTSSEDFKLSTFNTGTGALSFTAQNLDQAYTLDDRGIMSMGTSLNFGNFLPASLTMTMRPFIETRINLAVGSSLSRNKGQYRVFFSDGTGVYMTIANSKFVGAMPVQFAHRPSCAAEGENALGDAISFFGADNGYVYQLDSGTSFDGIEISANLTLAFNSIGSPRVLKRFRKASVELSGNSYAVLAFGYDLGYRSQEIMQPEDVAYSNDLRSAYWDEFIWDQFVWDAKDLSPTEVDVTGTAENIAVRLTSVSALYQPFTINSVILHYSMRRGLR